MVFTYLAVDQALSANANQSAESPTAIFDKGNFVKEIDDQLLARKIDFAVHSAKDLPIDRPAGLVIADVTYGPTDTSDSPTTSFAAGQANTFTFGYFGGGISYYDDSTGGNLVAEDDYRVFSQIIGDKIVVAMTDSGATDFPDRLVVFYGEADYSPGMTTTGPIANILDGDTYTLGETFTNANFTALMNAGDTPFLIAGTGGTVTLDQSNDNIDFPYAGGNYRFPKVVRQCLRMAA